MFRRSAIVVLVSFIAVAAGCGSSDTSGSAATAPIEQAPAGSPAVSIAPTTVEAQTGGIAGALQVAAGGIDDASAAVCDVDRRTLETASEAFLAMTGAFPTSQADLVTAGMIREPSTGLDVAADGSIVPIPGGPCAGS